MDGWREDLRLEEILAWYGAPVQVIWFLPKATYDQAGESTYLLFPERERFCVTDGWVHGFHASVHFRCFFYSPEEFDTRVFPYPVAEETEGYWTVRLDWPCPDL